jgi:hypothetical protein
MDSKAESRIGLQELTVHLGEGSETLLNKGTKVSNINKSIQLILSGRIRPVPPPKTP